MNVSDVQSRLAAAHLYSDKVDGDLGANTKKAINSLLLQQGVKNFDAWDTPRRLLAAEQLVCKLAGIEIGTIDGRMGPQTRYAFGVFNVRKSAGGQPVPVIETWRNDETAPQATPTRPLPAPITSSKVNAPSSKPTWPKQSAMDSFFGAKGSNQVTLTFPFPMRIAWETESKISRTSCNKRCAENFERIWVRTLDHYGIDEIRRLGLDLFGGLLNVRKMRGGSAWSIHSWGCAQDVDPDHNQLNFHRAKATLDNPPFDPFWRFVYDEGAIGLGRERDYDWMHFQFARL